MRNGILQSSRVGSGSNLFPILQLKAANIRQIDLRLVETDRQTDRHLQTGKLVGGLAGRGRQDGRTARWPDNGNIRFDHARTHARTTLGHSRDLARPWSNLLNSTQCHLLLLLLLDEYTARWLDRLAVPCALNS